MQRIYFAEFLLRKTKGLMANLILTLKTFRIENIDEFLM